MMDAVNLPLVAAAKSVTFAKFTGSEIEGNEATQTDGFSIIHNPPVGVSIVFNTEKASADVGASKSPLQNQIAPPGFFEDGSRNGSLQDELSSKKPFTELPGLSLKPTLKKEIDKIQGKARKISKSSSGLSGRRKSEGDNSPFSECDIHRPESFILLDKARVSKKRSHLDGKRAEKKNSRVPKKMKCSSFSPKSGLNLNSTARASNFFGSYGLKPESHDFIEHEAEVPMDKLLDGLYITPSALHEVKEEKIPNSNDGILNLVRNACSVLQRRKSVLDVESSKGSDYPSCSGSNKMVSCSGESIDGLLLHPEEVLKRLSLSMPKNLDYFLSNSIKASISSKNATDSRAGKMVSHRFGLPPFPWSHSVNANHKVSTDSSSKASTSKALCHGRWIRIKNDIATSSRALSAYADAAEELTFDQIPTPSGVKLDRSSNLSSSHIQERNCPMNSGIPSDTHSPRVLEAAEILYNIALRSKKINAIEDRPPPSLKRLRLLPMPDGTLVNTMGRGLINWRPSSRSKRSVESPGKEAAGRRG